MSIECIADRNQRCRPPAGAASAPATWLLLSPPRRAGLCCSLTPCSQYDQDVTTWSPQGRIFQIEYAMEAVKQGSAAVGLKVRPQFCLPLNPCSRATCLYRLRCCSSHAGCSAAHARAAAGVNAIKRTRCAVQSGEHAVLATIKRAPSDLSSYQRKVRLAGGRLSTPCSLPCWHSNNNIQPKPIACCLRLRACCVCCDALHLLPLNASREPGLPQPSSRLPDRRVTPRGRRLLWLSLRIHTPECLVRVVLASRPPVDCCSAPARRVGMADPGSSRVHVRLVFTSLPGRSLRSMTTWASPSPASPPTAASCAATCATSA